LLYLGPNSLIDFLPLPKDHLISNNPLTGTGASIARKFAVTYPVVLLARKPENYNPLVEEINSSGRKAVGISTDVTDSRSVKAAFEKIGKELPGLGLAAAVFNVGGRFVRKPFLRPVITAHP
jgi:NAD(P)-dependent dehydrogenase (short-subunit alcohol dehydrogenase family)